MTARLHDFTTLSFDCYGTLIDWETGIVEGLRPLSDRVAGLTHDQVLEAHAIHESTQQAETPGVRYRDLLSLVYRRLAEQWEIPVTREECTRYGRSVKDWPAFPDAVEALTYLARHFRLVILSNVDNESFAASNDRLGVTFDAVYTAEDIGSYKPSDANFDHMLRMLGRVGVARAEVLHVAESLFHDHVPANRHGLASAWIHRRAGRDGFGASREPERTPSYDFRFTSLGELVATHRAEAG